eukprot:scaffold7367_cov71-Cylindrotheca_fusiformis.AAC.1
MTGRGSIDGWTACPLCGKYSQKKYALGRGIATHLHAIHTPWKPTKLSLKIERRQREELERQQQQQQQCPTTSTTATTTTTIATTDRTLSWEPTQAEVDAWDEQVLQILSQIEPTSNNNNNNNIPTTTILPYRDSLPKFIKAAAEGDLKTCQEMVRATANNSTCHDPPEELQSLLNTRDRHLSTAEHWAAGGGHLDVLQYLFDVRNKVVTTSTTTTKGGGGTSNERKGRIRRRDGKTCLHYAARNGHLNCVQYLIHTSKFIGNETSGEGTTPFHMACYGGHLPVVQYLVVTANANANDNIHEITNEWGCNAFHFVGLTINDDETD